VDESSFRIKKTKVVSTTFNIKQKRKAEGCFSGYASVFDEVDIQHDLVVRGAFQETLQEWKKKSQKPKMLWQHEAQDPIGLWHHLYEDQQGLYVDGQLLLEIERAREAYVLMKAGVLDSLSIGYRVVEAIQSKNKTLRLLTKLDLFEISLVTFAANEKAKVTNLKTSYF
jgi:HK97 family phage prohead protease